MKDHHKVEYELFIDEVYLKGWKEVPCWKLKAWFGVERLGKRVKRLIKERLNEAAEERGWKNAVFKVQYNEDILLFQFVDGQGEKWSYTLDEWCGEADPNEGDQ